MTEVVLAFGTNLGNRLDNLGEALRRVGESGIAITDTSWVWETPPVPADQPPFLNAVATATTALSPRHLLERIKAVERDMGRTPTWRWGPRIIDIDILFFGNDTVREPDLTIPHPAIADRAFVLAPLAEVCPGPLPVLGHPAAELLGRLDTSGLRRLQALSPP